MLFIHTFKKKKKHSTSLFIKFHNFQFLFYGFLVVFCVVFLYLIQQCKWFYLFYFCVYNFYYFIKILKGKVIKINCCYRDNKHSFFLLFLVSIYFILFFFNSFFLPTNETRDKAGKILVEFYFVCDYFCVVVSLRVRLI